MRFKGSWHFFGRKIWMSTSGKGKKTSLPRVVSNSCRLSFGFYNSPQLAKGSITQNHPMQHRPVNCGSSCEDDPTSSFLAVINKGSIRANW